MKKQSEWSKWLTLFTDIKDEYILKAAENVPERNECIRLDHKYKHAERKESSMRSVSKRRYGYSYAAVGITVLLIVAIACLSSMLFGDGKSPLNPPKTVKEAMFPDIKEDERLVLATDSGTYFIDRNGIVRDWVKDCVYTESGISRKEKFIVSEDALVRLMIDEEKALLPWFQGLYSQKLHRWVVPQEYESMIKIDGHNGLYKAWKQTEEDVLKFDFDIIDASAPEFPIISSHYILEEIAFMNQAGSPYVSDGIQIWDYKGNQVYSSVEYEVTGLGREIAVLESDKIIAFYNLKTQTILAEMQQTENVDFAKQWFSIGSYMVDFLNGIIFDSENSRIFSVSEFAAEISGITKTNGTITLITLNPDNGDIIVCFTEKSGMMNQADSGIKTVYVCDIDGNQKEVYSDLIMVQGIYGLAEENGRAIRIDLITGEQITLPLELEMSAFSEMSMLAKDWIGLTSRSAELGNKTVICNNEIITERCHSWYIYPYGIEIGTYEGMEDRQVMIEGSFYRMDGKRFEGGLKQEEIVYLSNEDIAVENDGNVIVMDWDGNEIAVIELEQECSEWIGESALHRKRQKNW